MAISHIKNNTIADFTGTVTVFNSTGGTNTANATDLVRPSDWNSVHKINYALGGNTAGSASVSGNDVAFYGGNNITLSADTVNSRMYFSGADTTQFLTTAMQSNAGSGFMSTSERNNYQYTSNSSANTSVYLAVGNSTAYQTSVLSNTFQTAGAYLTTAMASNAAVQYVSNTSAITGSAMNTSERNNYQYTSNSSNNTSVYLSVGNSTAYQTSVLSNTFFPSSQTTKFAGTGTGFTGVNVFGSMTHNSNGLSLSLSAAAAGGGGGIAASIGGNSTSAGAGYSNITSGTAFFMGGNNVTLSQDGASVSINALAGAAPGGIGVSSQALGTTGLATNQMYIYPGTNITLSQSLNAGSASLTIIGGGAGDGGNTLAVAGSTAGSNSLVLFSNSPTVTFGMAGNTITASAAGGGGAGATISDWYPYPMALSTQTSVATGTVYFCPLIPQDNVSFSVFEVLSSNAMASGTGAFTRGMTLSYGLYSENGASLSLMSSSSIGLTISNNSSTAFGLSYTDGAGSFTLSTNNSSHSAWNGNKIVSLPFAGTMAGGGLYFWAQNMSTSSAGSNVALTLTQLFNIEVSQASYGVWGGTMAAGTNKSIVQEPYGFIRSASSAGLPASMAYSDASIYSNLQPYLYIEA